MAAQQKCAAVVGSTVKQRCSSAAYLSEKVLEVALKPDMPDRVGLRRREPGMLKTAAMVSLASPCRRMLMSRPLLPPVVLLQQLSGCADEARWAV